MRHEDIQRFKSVWEDLYNGPNPILPFQFLNNSFSTPTSDEISQIIKQMPSWKAPGSD